VVCIFTYQLVGLIRVLTPQFTFKEVNIMSEEVVKYTKSGAIATITLNRPEKANTIRPEMMYGIDDGLRKANMDDEVKVIILEGAGDNFCGGFDFSDGLKHTPEVMAEDYNPGLDVQVVTDPYHRYPAVSREVN
jgi:enoyl-CoA hydratase